MKGSEAEENVGTGRKKYGIDKYIKFDLDSSGKLKEIKMEIPWEVLFDPEKNKKLSEEIE